MQEQLIMTYQQLMGELGTLPAEIADAQNDLTKIKAQLALSKKSLDEAEVYAMATAEGSNDTKRKASANAALGVNGGYQRLLAMARAEQEQVDALTNDVDALTRQYGAVCYQARLHAALLTYLGNAGAPAAPVDSLGDVVFPTRTNGNSYVTTADAVTVADAADLGL